MANYENTSDLKKGVLHRCGELDDGSSEYDQKVIEYLNRAYQAVLSGSAELGIDLGEPWPWAQLRYPKVLTLLPAIDNIAVDATNNSTTITLGSVPPNNLQDWHIQFDGEPEVYRIATHSGVLQTATLDGVYVGETGTAKPCSIFKIDYDLDIGMLRLVSPMRTFSQNVLLYNQSPGQIQMVDEAEFARQFPVYSIQTGTPTAFAQIHKTNTMQVTVRFNAVPDQLTRVEYNYIPVPVDLYDDQVSVPIVPRDHRIALEYYASYYLMLDKNDNRTQEFRELTRASLVALVNAYKREALQTNPDYGRMIPRADEVYDYRRIFDWWES